MAPPVASPDAIQPAEPDPMRLADTLRATVIAAYPELADIPFDLQPAPDNQPGDVGLACFRFAKVLATSPPEVAKRLAGLEWPAPVMEAVVAGPYLNVTLDRNAVATDILAEIVAGQFGSGMTGAGQRVVIEHTSINPNASPHIGRARNGLIGDTLTRLLRFEGYDVDVHYYVNDMGKQIALLSLQTEGKESLRFDEVLAEYVAANRRAEEDPAFEQAGLALLARMEEGDPEVRATFTRLVDICLNGQLAIFDRLGLSFDRFDRESAFLTSPHLPMVLDVLREKGSLFTDDQGRTVADLQPLGYPREEGRYVVLLRANGSSLYFYRDIAYTLEKIDRGGDHTMIVLGEDHTMYYEQLATIIRALGKVPPEAVHYSYILLKDGKMSTRQGTVVLLEDFLDEAIRRARERVDEQWKDLAPEDRAEIARVIGIGAVRFAILSVRSNRNVIFDWESALSFTGDSGPYIQYSCTRIASILRKAGIAPGELPAGPVTITHDAEWQLVLRLAWIPADINVALTTRNPAVVATAALDLARRFSTFYTECQVLAAEEPSRSSRLALSGAVQRVLITLLSLLGIEAPERM